MHGRDYINLLLQLMKKSIKIYHLKSTSHGSQLRYNIIWLEQSVRQMITIQY